MDLFLKIAGFYLWTKCQRLFAIGKQVHRYS